MKYIFLNFLVCSFAANADTDFLIDPKLNIYVLTGEVKLQDSWVCSEWQGTNANAEPECSQWQNNPIPYLVAQDKFSITHVFRFDCTKSAITIDNLEYNTRTAFQCHDASDIILKNPTGFVLVIDEPNSTLVNILKADDEFQKLWARLLALLVRSH